MLPVSETDSAAGMPWHLIIAGFVMAMSILGTAYVLGPHTLRSMRTWTRGKSKLPSSTERKPIGPASSSSNVSPKSVGMTRFAEKNRNSTCAFADRVASLVISTFHANCPQDLLSSYRQTVLAGFVLENCRRGTLHVVAIGVGTKYLCQRLIQEDKQGVRVRDSHAEILAKRALQRFLYNQVRRALIQHTSGNSADPSIFEIVTPKFPQSGKKLKPLRLRENIRLHFYSSSVPCGNASIKRWAHPKRPRPQDLPDHKYPEEPHPRFHVMQPEQGQVAPLVKLERPPEVRLKRGTHPTNISSMFLPIIVAPGTAPLGSGFGQTLTCSDKIALYNALGVQGCLLSCFFDPIYMKTFTVGRKFSEKTCQRALCCRIADFSYGDHLEYCVHHPSMLQTSVKFDRGLVKSGSNGRSDACFHESRCMSWWRDSCDIDGFGDMDGSVSGVKCILDGLTGMSTTNESGISRAELLGEFVKTMRLWQPQKMKDMCGLTASATKEFVTKHRYTLYQSAKRKLLWEWFPEWASAKGLLCIPK